jgi:ATP-binding cassette, subfamily F, member 3
LNDLEQKQQKQRWQKAWKKVELIELEHEQKSVTISFPEVQKSGKMVLQAKNLSKSFDNKSIFKNASFELKRGEKAAIVAANGKGKTTLINVLTSIYACEHGSISFGHNVDWVLFEQDQTRILDKNKEILQEVEDSCKTSEARKRVRSLLGAFLFPGDDVKKKIRVLSGGEKNRVAIVKILLQNANFLILDEPTNHLDIQSKEILLKALQQFPGTILFVSHDRDFIDGLATKILELTPTEVFSYDGNYESFLYQKQQNQKLLIEEIIKKNTTSYTPKKDSKKKSGKKEHARQKEIKKIEAKLENLEQKRKQLLHAFEHIKYGTEEFDTNTKLLNDTEKEIKNSYGQWEELNK